MSYGFLGVYGLILLMSPEIGLILFFIKFQASRDKEENSMQFGLNRFVAGNYLFFFTIPFVLDQHPILHVLQSFSFCHMPMYAVLILRRQ
jgi:hypothetical protein